MISTLLNSGYTGSELFFLIIVSLFAIVLSFSVHEFAHSLAATKLGDNTSKNMGRLTLNPLSHLDPLGTVLLLLFGFGWESPLCTIGIILLNLRVEKHHALLSIFQE